MAEDYTNITETLDKLMETIEADKDKEGFSALTAYSALLIVIGGSKSFLPDDLYNKYVGKLMAILTEKRGGETDGRI